MLKQCNQQVSGEYSMIWHAANNGVFDLRTGVMEATEAAVRAGTIVKRQNLFSTALKLCYLQAQALLSATTLLYCSTGCLTDSHTFI
jgi:hypothetical protein